MAALRLSCFYSKLLSPPRLRSSGSSTSGILALPAPLAHARQRVRYVVIRCLVEQAMLHEKGTESTPRTSCAGCGSLLIPGRSCTIRIEPCTTDPTRFAEVNTEWLDANLVVRAHRFGPVGAARGPRNCQKLSCSWTRKGILWTTLKSTGECGLTAKG